MNLNMAPVRSLALVSILLSTPDSAILKTLTILTTTNHVLSFEDSASQKSMNTSLLDLAAAIRCIFLTVERIRELLFISLYIMVTFSFLTIIVLFAKNT